MMKRKRERMRWSGWGYCFYAGAMVMWSCLLMMSADGVESEVSVIWRMVDGGEKTYEARFEGEGLGEGILMKHGEWAVEDGLLVGRELESEGHGANVRVDAPMEDTAVCEIEFRFGESEEVSVSLAGKGQGRVLVVTPEAFWFRIKAGKEGEARVWGFTRCDLGVDEWHVMRVEVAGEEFVASVDGKWSLYGKDEKVAGPKTSLSLGAEGEGAAFRGIRVWRGEVVAGWGEGEGGRPELGAPLGLGEYRFLRADGNGDGVVSLAEYGPVYGVKDSESEVRARFEKSDRDGDGVLSAEEAN
jgi:hypothetical protein